MAVVGQGAARRGGASALTTAVIPYLTAGVALVGANALVLDTAGSPPPPQAEIRVVSQDVQLAGSLLNIPINLLIDIINIPYYEQQALDVEARAFLYSGPWAVTSPANVWGEDPADFARFYALAASLIPIPALSGLSTSTDWSVQQEEMISNNGFANQFAKFLAAEWTVQPTCTALKCVPNTPVSPITGIAGIDTSIWTLMMLLGKVDFPVITSVIRNFFEVGLQPLFGGYSFGDQPSYDGQIYDELGIKGTVLSDDGTTWLMPWSNTEFKLDLIGPFVNWFNQLTDDPANNPIKLPSLEDFGRTLQTFLAGLIVAFNPFTPGSSLCPGFCAYMSQDQASPAIVQFIENMWPGNKSLQAWLANYKAGTSNMPSDEYIDHNINLWRNAFFNMWSFGNPLMEDGNINYGGNPSGLAQFFHGFWTSLGLTPPPLEVDSSYVTDANLQGGVYALKGQEIPILLILESDQQNVDQATNYVGSFLTPPAPGQVVNTIWWEPSDQVGIWSVNKTIGADKTPTIYGFDKGALIASNWKRWFNDNYDPEAGVTPKFVLTGNITRPNGGLSTRLDTSDPSGLGKPYTVATPTTTTGSDGITTTDIAYQYDPWADLPTNLLNPFSLLNSLAAIGNHYKYSDSADPKEDSLYQGSYGDTDYYLTPSSTMPLLSGLNLIPFVGSTLVDMLDPITRVLVETGYDRTISPGDPTSANFFYLPDLGKLLFSTIPTAILTGLDNGFEAVGMGRVFGTTRPDTTSSNGAYGIGGPNVDVGQQNLTTSSTGTSLLAAAKSVSTYQAASVATGDGSDTGAGTSTESTGSTTATTTGTTESTGTTTGTTESTDTTTGSTGSTGTTESTGSSTDTTESAGSTDSTTGTTGTTESTGSTSGTTGSTTDTDASGSTGHSGTGSSTDDNDSGSGSGSASTGSSSSGSSTSSTGSGSGSTGSGSGGGSGSDSGSGSGSGSDSGSGSGSGSGSSSGGGSSSGSSSSDN